MEPLVIVVLIVASMALASVGARGFLGLVLHLMSRNTMQPVPVPVSEVQTGYGDASVSRAA